jgi:membrane-bound metal-dependent hydrolase YbcI (DUF457 family)
VLTAFLSRFILQVLAPIILIDMNIVWWCFMIGVVSHFILDIPTKEGLPLLWPWQYKFGIPPFRSLRIEAGGVVERFIAFPGMLLLSGYLLYHNQARMLTFLHHFVR